ncbi:MAG: alpha/beta fold hydrolase [Ignavibacteriaceae bacterium]|nr:alpha/beta fold hydrolase [Ignavibacteriaceae bacterium]
MTTKIFSALFILFFSSTIFPQLKYSNLDDFNLENGAVIKNCFVAYRTFGTPNEDKSNVLLFPTWFAGTSEHLANYTGKGKMADSTKFFVIAVDALGDGVSSSPSNSKEQPGSLFPVFSVHDMVESQYRMLKKEFGYDSIYGIIGGSMGGMQVFDWITSYPSFIKKAVAYVGSPKLTFYDKLLWHTELKTIELGIMGNIPDSIACNAVSSLQTSHIRSIKYYNDKYSPEEFDNFIGSNYAAYKKLYNSYNWASQLKAMLMHDVYKKFKNGKQDAASVFKGNLFVIVGANDMMVNPSPAIEFAGLSGAKLLVLENDCGHLSPGCDLVKFESEINEFWSGGE